MTNIFTGLTVLATILTIASYIWNIKDNKKLQTGIKILNVCLLAAIVCLSSKYYETVNAQQRAEVFYERYSNTSFENDFSDSKIRVVVNDGLVIFYDLKLDQKYPQLSNEIESRYQIANENGVFDREQYILIARDLFGILGSVSGELFDGSYLSGAENNN